MKRITVIAFCILCHACGISEVGRWVEPDTGDAGEGIGTPLQKVCCVTGIDYPGGYEWAKDVSGVQVKCSLVVFADGVPAMKFPVGDGFEMSSDPDAHRMFQGNLYTFFSKDGISVVKKNGAPLFRYEGDEILLDMLIREDDVHTLTGRRSGGFVYRKNGESLVERHTGNLFGKLWEDGDSVCFAFSHPVALQDGMDERYYLSVNSAVTQIEIEREVSKVWDIRSRKGIPVCLVSSVRWGSVMLYEADSKKEISLPASTQMLSCAMFTADGQIGVECVYSYEDGTCESGLWVEGAEYVRFEAGKSIFAMCYSNGNAYCVLNPDDEDGLIFDAGDVFSMPVGYSCLGSQTVAVSDDEMYVAMSSRTGGRPVLWKDGQVDTLRLNGYLCSVSFTGGTPENYP